MELSKQEPTQEELDQMRDKMDEFYKKQMPYLETQAKFEKYLADIEEARFKRAHYNNQLVQAMIQQKEIQDQANGVTKKTKLKKEQ